MDKWLAWASEIEDAARAKGPCERIGDDDWSVNHAAYVVPNSRPFLGRLLYLASKRAQTCGAVKLSDSQVADLKLWEVFLDAATEGISTNCLVFRWPTRTVRVDSCPQGMGGYGLQSGIAWRLLLPPDWIGRGSLNCLKFLSALVGVWVEHQVGEPWVEDNVLASLSRGQLIRDRLDCPIEFRGRVPPPSGHCADHGTAHDQPRVDALFAMVPGQRKFGR